MLEELEESLERSNEMKKIVLEQYLYYTIIFISSLIVLVFLPMVGSVAGVGFSFPSTKLGWAIYIITKVFVASFNLLIFHCFIKQGKVNARNDEHYLLACKKQNVIDHKRNTEPRSPKKFLSGEYSKKGVTIFVCTCISLVVLTQAILTFDWMALITYLVTVVMGVVFGVMEMVKVTNYWKTEYVLYVDKLCGQFDVKEADIEEKKEEPKKVLTNAEATAKTLLPMEVK